MPAVDPEESRSSKTPLVAPPVSLVFDVMRSIDPVSAITDVVCANVKSLPVVNALPLRVSALCVFAVAQSMVCTVEPNAIEPLPAGSPIASQSVVVFVSADPSP